MAKSSARPGNRSMKRRGSERRGSSAAIVSDMDHHGTRGKIPATTRTMKITAAETAQVSSERRGDFEVFVLSDMVRAPNEASMA
jgi:hypothetical protein